MWNLLCQYNNIYKRKKKYKQKTKNKIIIKIVTIVATMPPGTVAIVRNFKKKKRQSASLDFHYRWTVGYVEWIVHKYYSSIAAFYIVNRYEVWTLLLLRYLSL